MTTEHKERYFFISYKALVPTGYTNGNISFSNDRFPSRAWFGNLIMEKRKDEGVANVVIQSIFEFQCREDYEAFNNVSPTSAQ
jgi:hypothetical protein